MNTLEAETPSQTDSESSAAEEKGFYPVLKNGRFLLLWGGQIFSQLADKIYLVLAIASISRNFQTADEPISGWVSALMIAFTIPAILFGSLAGAYVDRWSKKTVLVGTNILRGVLVWSIPLVLYFSAEWPSVMGLPVGFILLLLVTFLVSTLTQFFAPAEQSAIPLLVERRYLLPANSLYTTTMMASLIVGFAIGEPLLALTEQFASGLGLHWQFSNELVVGGAYAIAGIILIFIRTGEKLEVAKKVPHVWEDIRDGIGYLRANDRIRNAMVQLIILFCVFAALAVLSVRLAEIIPGLSASQFGFLLASGAVGMAGGAAFLGTWGDRFSNGQLSAWGSLGVAGSLVGIACFTQHLWLVLLMTLILGLAAAAIGIPMQTTIQAETPETMRGKVFGLQNNAVNIALSLPLALASVAEAWWGLEAVFASLAVLVVVGRVVLIRNS